MGSGYVMLIGIIFIGIVIGYFVGKKIEDKFRERNTRKA